MMLHLSFVHLIAVCLLWLPQPITPSIEPLRYFHRVPDLSPIFPETGVKELQNIELKDCARNCHSQLVECKSFVYEEDLKICWLLAEKFPFDTGIVERPGVDWFYSLEDKKAEDYFYYVGTGRWFAKRSYWSQKISLVYSITDCMNLCLHPDNYKCSTIRYDTIENSCLMSELQFPTAQAEYWFRKDNFTYTFSKYPSSAQSFTPINGFVPDVSEKSIMNVINVTSLEQCTRECQLTTPNPTVCAHFYFDPLPKHTNCVLMHDIPLDVKFKSLGTIVYFTMTPALDCKGSETLIDESGSISSPGWPLPYQSNANCSWTIQSRMGQSIFLKGSLIDLHQDKDGKCIDYIQLNNEKQTICSSTTAKNIIDMANFTNTGKQNIQLDFISTSDNPNKRIGFQVFYESDWNCGNNEMITEANGDGVIISKNYPLPYDNLMECKWTIKASKKVTLIFDSFDVGVKTNSSTLSCFGGDSVKIKSSTNLEIAYCGNEIPTIQPSNSFSIVFQTYTNIEKSKGFHLKYFFNSIPQPIKCDTNYTVSKTTPSTISLTNIRSSREVNCNLYISGPTDAKSLLVKFQSFGIGRQTHFRQCTDGYVKLKSDADYGENKHFLCGKDLPDPILSAGSNLNINLFLAEGHLLSDEEAIGFVMTVQASDEQKKDGLTYLNGQVENKTISSPNYPSNYPSNIYIFWTISPQNEAAKNKVMIRFIDIDIKIFPPTYPVTTTTTTTSLSQSTTESSGGGGGESELFCDWDHITMEIGNMEILICGNGLWLDTKSGPIRGQRDPFSKLNMDLDLFITATKYTTVTFATNNRWSSRGFKAEVTDIIAFQSEKDKEVVVDDEGYIYSQYYPVKYVTYSSKWLVQHKTFTAAKFTIKRLEWEIPVESSECDPSKILQFEDFLGNKGQFCTDATTAAYAANEYFGYLPITVTMSSNAKMLMTFTYTNDLPPTQSTLPTTTEYVSTELTTEVLTTELLTTELLTTEEPTTELLTTEEPTTELLTTEEPTTELLTTEEPTTELLTTEEPTTELITTEEPTTELLTTEEPTTELLTTEEPTTELLTTEEPTTELLTTDEPTTELLTTEEVSTSENVITDQHKETTTEEIQSTEELTSPDLQTTSWDFTTMWTTMNPYGTVKEEGFSSKSSQYVYLGVGLLVAFLLVIVAVTAIVYRRNKYQMKHKRLRDDCELEDWQSNTLYRSPDEVIQQE